MIKKFLLTAAAVVVGTLSTFADNSTFNVNVVNAVHAAVFSNEYYSNTFDKDLTEETMSFNSYSSDRITITALDGYTISSVEYTVNQSGGEVTKNVEPNTSGAYVIQLPYTAFSALTVKITVATGDEEGDTFEPTDTDYVVYYNGSVPDMGKGIEYYAWWEASVNFAAANPSGGDSKVFEFKSSTGGADASMGLNMEAPLNTGFLHDATLNFSWYATTEATYTIRLTSVATNNYAFTPTADQLNKWNTTSLKVSEIFPDVAAQWDENKNLGQGYVFGVIMANGSQESVIYFDKVYYSNIDNSWKAPESNDPMPETVPVPEQDADDVYSFFSTYGNNVNFGVGGWGQSTQQSTIQVDGKDVIMLRNFNYIGWVNFNINISDYDYMHVDYWTAAEEGTSFGFVPISLNPTLDTPIWIAPSIKVGEWNSYDAPLNGFNADMSKIEQIKFVANENGTTSTDLAYIANVYFYKDENGGGGEEPEQPEEPGEGKTYTDSVKGVFAGTYNYTFDYSITYNENQTLTLVGKFKWETDPTGIITIYYANVNNDGEIGGVPQGEAITTTRTYTAGQEIPVKFYTMASAELGNPTVEISYTVGSENTDTGIDAIQAAEGAARYFNLQGVEVQNPEKGIVIKVQNGRATKIML